MDTTFQLARRVGSRVGRKSIYTEANPTGLLECVISYCARPQNVTSYGDPFSGDSQRDSEQNCLSRNKTICFCIAKEIMVGSRSIQKSKGFAEVFFYSSMKIMSAITTFFSHSNYGKKHLRELATGTGL
jgi:hypothetical protein